MDQKYLKLMQVRTAQVAIGHSTLRNQGAPDVIATARNYLSKIDLGKLAAAKSEKDYLRLLDTRTKTLANRFPGEAKGNWGAARKALNIFMRDCLYNAYLREHYSLGMMECWLEVPLDRDVGTSLYHALPDRVPRWKTIKRLTPEISRQFQAAAEIHASVENVCKVHLDLKFWRNGAKGK